MSNLLTNFKNCVNRMVRRLGYQIQKLPPAFRKTSDVVDLFIGGKTIKVHGGSPLRYVYDTNPDYNIHLAQLAALVNKKYPLAWAMDVGANVGDTLAIIKSNASLPVICVEGDTHCFQLLQENARLFKDVQVFNVFLADKPGTSWIQMEKEGWNTTLSTGQSGQSGREVRFETLDGLFAKIDQQPQVKLLKVDAEGFDMRILRGAPTILETTRPILSFELNIENIGPLGDSVSDFFEYLIKKDFNNFILADPGGKPICTLSAGDQSVFSSLYEYSGPGGAICYFDVIAFHQDDKDLFEIFLTKQSAKI